MPFLTHFGLVDYPFTLTPNPDYYFPCQEHVNIVASLEFALQRNAGIVKVVGEIGTGKTMLCRLLLSRLEEYAAVAYINAPQCSLDHIVTTVCEEFGVPLDGNETPHRALNRFLIEQYEQGRLAIVVVDEAQALGREGLEAIRLLSNLETERAKLLQIVLFGQTELDELLADKSLRQLNQRMAFVFGTNPMSRIEARRYITHRIRCSRHDGATYEVFTPGALDLIARHSNGIPRLINILADKSLLAAFSDGAPQVKPVHAEEAINDSPQLVRPVPFHRRSGGRRLVYGGVFVMAVLLTVAVAAWNLAALDAPWR